MSRLHAQPAAGGSSAAELLTSRIAAGDEAAFTEFYETWFASTLALSRAISRRDESWCLDVVQDVMLTVAKKLPALKSDEALRSWVTRVVVNTVTDRTRSEARRRRREQTAQEGVSITVDEPWLHLCDQERRSWLETSVTELTAVEQELLQARFGGSSTVAAAAEALGISSDAAHGRLRRVMERLRQKAADMWAVE